MAQENFEKISRIIRKEFEAFDIKKCQDFKQTILQYLEQMLKYEPTQLKHYSLCRTFISCFSSGPRRV